MNFKRIGNKRDEILVTVQNNDVTTLGGNGIGPGVPLVLQYPGASIAANQYLPSGSSGVTDDNGLGVLLPSSSANTSQAHNCFYGINTGSMGYLQQGAALVSGYYETAILTIQTRVSSSNVWAATTYANWAALGLDTVNNAFTTIASTVGIMPFACLLGAISVTGTASNATVTTNTNTLASSASTTADTRTAITMSARVQIRVL